MHREAKPIVAAFSESPLLRETLAVLLERDCRLKFVSPHTAAPFAGLSPDLALLAIAAPGALLSDLAREWPQLPVVAIDPRDIGGAHAESLRLRSATVETVALEPQAIRAAVLRRLPPRPADHLLRSVATAVGDTLRAELRYPFAMLRSLPALCPPGAGPDTGAIVAAILGEQAAVIGEQVEQLERFRARPRIVQRSEEFISAVCRALEQPDAAAAQRGLLCVCTVESAAAATPGPVALAPLVAVLVRAHLRRRSELPIIAVHATAHGISMHYRLRLAAQAETRSWPLLLADLALAACCWGISTVVSDGDETLGIRPTDGAYGY